jgi:hypothetical protein
MRSARCHRPSNTAEALFGRDGRKEPSESRLNSKLVIPLLFDGALMAKSWPGSAGAMLRGGPR